MLSWSWRTIIVTRSRIVKMQQSLITSWLMILSSSSWQHHDWWYCLAIPYITMNDDWAIGWSDIALFAVFESRHYAAEYIWCVLFLKIGKLSPAHAGILKLANCPAFFLLNPIGQQLIRSGILKPEWWQCWIPDKVMDDDVRCPEVFDHVRTNVDLAPTPVSWLVQDHPAIARK